MPSLIHARTKAPSDGTEEDLDDPRALVISSLRTQISDLFSQVNLLNSKPVQSYNRVSTSKRRSTITPSGSVRLRESGPISREREKGVLELERAKQEQMVKNGRLVERSAAAAELSWYLPRRILSSHLMTILTLPRWSDGVSSSAKQSAEAKHKQMGSELSVTCPPRQSKPKRSRRQSIVITDSPTTPTPNSSRTPPSYLYPNVRYPAVAGPPASSSKASGRRHSEVLSLVLSAADQIHRPHDTHSTPRRTVARCLGHRLPPFSRGHLPLRNLPRITVRHALFAIPAGVLLGLRPPVSFGVA
jgi:hypothetical protein